MKRKFYIETLGCPKNINDSEYAAGVLCEKGYEEVFDPKDADFVIVNTCGFIEDAKRESIDKIFELSEAKNEDAKLIVSGCLAQRYAEELRSEIPEADCFIGVEQYGNIGDILYSVAEEDSGARIFTEMCNPGYLERVVRKYRGTPYTSTIKIAEGCNNRCSYCAIPFIRGNYRSKKIEDILDEARDLASAGCKELILIAQDTGYYGKDLYKEFMLPKLLEELVLIDGIEWIRIMYCYDDRITDELIEVIAREEKICKYIDLPLQHGSNKVLKEMRRNSTNESIRAVINKLRDRIPDIVIRTTMIVGFPGETEEDFNELIDLVEDVKFDRMGAFKYSLEEGTEAGKREDQIDEETKEARLDALMRRQMDISYFKNLALVGSEMDVMVDEIDLGEASDSDISYIGRTRFDAPEIDNGVIFKCPKTRVLMPGDIVRVRITDAFDYDLIGELCQ